jgi:AbrB family looped-hinge helix DNA binding protein
MKAILSEKGQVTIPKRCREKLGLRPGTVLEFEAVEGQLVARKVQPVDVLQRWRGKGRLPGGASVDGYLARIRG